jgi:hypothetical protein
LASEVEVGEDLCCWACVVPWSPHHQPMSLAIQHHPSNDPEAFRSADLVYPCSWILSESPGIRNAISQPGSPFVRKNGVAGARFSAPPRTSLTVHQQTATLRGPKRELRGHILVDSWTIDKSWRVAFTMVTRSSWELGRSSVCVSNVGSPTAQC